MRPPPEPFPYYEGATWQSELSTSSATGLHSEPTNHTGQRNCGVIGLTVDPAGGRCSPAGVLYSQTKNLSGAGGRGIELAGLEGNSPGPLSYTQGNYKMTQGIRTPYCGGKGVPKLLNPRSQE